MPDYTESELRDKIMSCYIEAGTVPAAINDSMFIASIFFTNKKRNIFALSMSNKKNTPVTVIITYKLKVLAKWTLPANTQPQLHPILCDIKSPFLSVLGYTGEMIFVSCSDNNGADVNVTYYDEP
jgi:hypothetical protein